MSMIPEDCFLRKLPIGISLVQRMKLDGVRIAAEMVELSNNRLIAVALHISREQQLNPNGDSMTALQTDAWSIVNHCHTIRKILQSSPEIDTNGIATFLESTKDVSEVRDAHHHYYSQIENRSQKKRKTFPLYGAVSWTYGVGARPQGVHFVTCWKGAMHEPKVTAGFQIPGDGLRLPIGNVHLQAFDYDIDLQKVTDAVASLIQHLNTEVAELARKCLDKVAAERNVDREKLNANVAADMFFALWGEISWGSSGSPAPQNPSPDKVA
jgi:hypothetical protein